MKRNPKQRAFLMSLSLFGHSKSIHRAVIFLELRTPGNILFLWTAICICNNCSLYKKQQYGSSLETLK